ncbi:MAG: hypothetical protein GTN49_01325 [candidate division Zixibacteria bacterium]|nr:hypothetical protein [candidate division Zixibacteria bacterium]
MSKLSLLVILVFIGAAAGLLAVLPPDAFFSSDEGVKFIQLRSLAENGFRSARIRWPGDELGLERRYAVVERFFELRGGELYSPHPLLFALASAPGWLAFGFRGLYVLPLLAGVATVLLTIILGRAFGARRPWLAGAVVAFASPIFFYSLCYWEHTPAVALWLGGFVLLLRKSTARLAFAGALWGLGAALRPEFYWLAAWTVAALFIFHKGERLRTAAWPAAAFLSTAAAFELLTRMAWGQPAFMRVGANLGYGVPRGPAAFIYALGHSLVAFVPWYLAVGTAAVIGFILLGIKWRGGTYAAAACAVALTLLSWRFFRGYATPLAATFPAAFGLVFLALPEVRRSFRGTAALEKSFYVAAAAFAATLFVVIPDTSGYAWGPRFLLFVVPAAAVALAKAAEGGGGRGWSLGAAFVISFVALSVATQLFGLARLAGTKAARHDLTADLASLVPAPVLTNKWYLPAYAAPLYFRQPFVLVTEERRLPAVGEKLAARGVGRAYFLSELPPDAAERDDYILGLTTTLARDFDLTDLRPARRSSPRRYGAPPFYIWFLRIMAPKG